MFDVLQSKIGVDVDFDNGRPGMDLWVLLVLCSLRLGLNCDYDRLHDLANEHKTIRSMLGHGDWRDEHLYGLQTLRDNVVLLTEEKKKKAYSYRLRNGHTYRMKLKKTGGFQDYAVLLMDQIKRRVLEDKVIPASEKIYSIFQPHTEWISTKSRHPEAKGKQVVLPKKGKVSSAEKIQARTAEYRKASGLALLNPIRHIT